MNGPKRPLRRTIGLPHFGQASSIAGAAASPPSAPPGPPLPPAISWVLRHSGYPEQARNFPYRPHLITIGLPHFSHVDSVGISSVLTLRISVEARLRSFWNFALNSFSASTHFRRPSSISSSSSSRRAV